MSEGLSWRRFGESVFTFTDSSFGVELRLRNVRAEDGHIYADLFAYEMVGRQDWGKVLVRPRANLTSVRTIPDLAKALAERKADYNWREMLENICSILVEQMDARGELTILGELDDAELVQPELIDMLAPEDALTAIVSNGGVGKSLVAMMLAIAVSTGQPVGPFRPRQSGVVLYADWENEHKIHSRRLTRITRGLGLQVPKGRIVHYRAKSSIAKCEAELGEVAERHGAILTIADSIGFAAGGNLNASEVAMGAIESLKHLPRTKIMLAHLSKSSLDSDSAAPIGSVFFWNGCHAVWSLKATDPELDGSITLSLYQDKANLGRKITRPMGVGLTFEDPGGRITPRSVDIRGDTEAGMRMPLNLRINDVLKDGRQTAEDVALALGFTEKSDFETVKRTLEGMAFRKALVPFVSQDKRVPTSYGLPAERAEQQPAREFICQKCGREAVAYTDQGIAVCDDHNLD